MHLLKIYLCNSVEGCGVVLKNIAKVQLIISSSYLSTLFLFNYFVACDLRDPGYLIVTLGMANIE